jgi:hypothetical protein
MMDCIFTQEPDGTWTCSQCKRNTGRAFVKPPRRMCRLGIVQSEATCSFAPIISRLTLAGVDRLQRCREAGCKLMLPVEGSMRCTGMGGGKCTWIAEWAKRLNDPEWVCPHWITV